MPGFKGLVEEVYKRLNINIVDFLNEKNEFEKENFDRVLGLLEQRIDKKVGITPTFRVRNTIKNILQITPNADLSTHKAILDLSETNPYRLITTNFDYGFINSSSHNYEAASKLIFPKRKRWKNVTYLHGIFDEENDPNSQEIIITSADFGRAYLTEGWAAKFVAELFSRYTVLFIGYSINDPVLRYICDAIAVDRDAGENIKDVYAFASCTEQDSERIKI